METKPFGNPLKAKLLIIGHDPRLTRSNTIAEYCFFADYFFRKIPNKNAERKKYDLASSLFAYIGYLTNYRYKRDEILITNLCNCALPTTNGKGTVYISEEKAKKGLDDIYLLIQKSRLELILAQSQQVNYWLQVLGFYMSDKEFIKESEPNPKFIKENIYKPLKDKAFLKICGKIYLTKDSIRIIPILHVKQYNAKFKLNDNIKAYTEKIENCINILK